MMIVGVLLIVAVFLDGYRRVRNERRNRIRVSLSKQVFQHHSDDYDDPDADEGKFNPELPNGGARVLRKRNRAELQRDDDELQLHESVPLLMESVRVAPAPACDAAPPAAAAPQWEEEEEEEQQELLEPEPERAPAQVERELPLRAEREDVAPEPSARLAVAASATEVNQAPREVLVINVLSKDKKGFNGPDLLQILLACDLRFGKMNIFHRYEKANGRGQVQFSVANLVEPGTFNLDAIDGFCTPGVSFFLALPGPEAPIRAFDYMVETAQVLVKNLHAELRDEAHSAMTSQTLEHCRQRIRDFERRQLTLQV
jgi:cell division protein ZipA